MIFTLVLVNLFKTIQYSLTIDNSFVLNSIIIFFFFFEKLATNVKIKMKSQKRCNHQIIIN